jgi:hypothetical protein
MKLLCNRYFNIDNIKSSDGSYIFTLSHISHSASTLHPSIVNQLVYELHDLDLYTTSLYDSLYFQTYIYKNTLHNILLHYKSHQYIIVVLGTLPNIISLYGFDSEIDYYKDSFFNITHLTNKTCFLLTHSSIETIADIQPFLNSTMKILDITN